jgi:hypothetical protein
MHNECIIDSHLRCVGKREFTKRGARFAQLKLQRGTSSYTVRFIVPGAQADTVELGGWYKIAILPDSASR